MTKLKAWHAVATTLAAAQAPVSNPDYDDSGGVDEILGHHPAGCLLCTDNTFGKAAASGLWLALLCWLFVAMAIVADDYLMPALRIL